MGIVHSIYALGRSFVLRVPKMHPYALADAYTGSVAAPAAVRAGVSTPPLVVFDETLAIVPVPFSIFERVQAEPFSERLGAVPQEHSTIWRQLGSQLATLHANAITVADPHAPTAPAWPTPSGRLFDLLAAAADGQAPIVRHLHR
jgi:aminoglycoside phosphotransferase (APT) family kinase protein